MSEEPFWLEAVVRRFPNDVGTIEKMSARPGPFRDMCEELVEAEKELQATDLAPPQIREARRAEWRSAIETLTQEIEQALRESNVVRMSRRPPKLLK